MTPTTLYRFMSATLSDRPQLFRMLRPYRIETQRDASADAWLASLMSIAMRADMRR